MRFRTYSYGLSTDFEKAFLHVGLPEYDRDFTRFLWLADPTDPESAFQIYRFKVVLFGSTSSPFMLNATLHSHLENYTSPIAKNIKNDLYVATSTLDETQKKKLSNITVNHDQSLLKKNLICARGHLTAKLFVIKHPSRMQQTRMILLTSSA